MPLTITKHEAADAFKAALASHDYDTAGEQITALGMSEALAACLQYEKENPGEAHSLNLQLQIRGFGLSTVSFVVQVAQFVPVVPPRCLLAIPQRCRPRRRQIVVDMPPWRQISAGLGIPMETVSS